MRIGNDAPTFNAAHLAGSVFLFRDATGDHALVSTDAGPAHREGLWCLFRFFEFHVAPPGQQIGIVSGFVLS